MMASRRPPSHRRRGDSDATTPHRASDGKWPKDDSDQGIIGKTLATELGVTTGDTVTLNKTTASGKKNEQKINAFRG